MQRFAHQILDALERHTGLPRLELRLEHPRDPRLGDLAFPCFPLAKARRAPPPAIAAELAPVLQAELDDIRAVASGPYVNFTVDRGILARSILSTIEEAGTRYGCSDEGRGRTVVIDFSSPNIAKPMHVGHLRSTIIGAAVKRLFEAQGCRAVGINHIGDWGAQFGKLVAALRRWGSEVDLEADPIRAMLALYVRYHEEEKTDPSLDEEARAAFRELESGVEGEVRAIWRRLTELSMKSFQRIYERLGVEFDLVRGESYYEPHLEPTIERIAAPGVAERSQGALIVDLEPVEKGMPPCLLRKSDGTTLYATRDLAALFQRWEEFHFERCIYFVGSEQKLHFRQLKAVLKRMKVEWEPRVEHAEFGLLRLPEGKLTTRGGRVVFLEDVLDQVVDEARRIIAEKNPGLPDRGRVAEQVGIGAVVFDDLRRERVRDIVFDIQELLSFEGETGPYVQYTHARLASILRKAGEDRGAPGAPTPGASGAEPDFEQLENAGSILVRLGRFPEVVRSAAGRAEPSEVSTYLLGLCRELNSWYVENRVLGVDPRLSAARLALIRGSKCVLRNGLGLLGVAAPDEM